MSKTLLVILDGWGYGNKDNSDAIFNANTPFFDACLKQYPNATLLTDGENVGLPTGQMGNSEVGHMNIGAGRIVYQDLAKINRAVESGDFQKHPIIQHAFELAKQGGRKLHFMGLVSEGGVHSHQNHLVALCKASAEYGITKSYIHAFTDGRDTDPKSGKGYVKSVLTAISETPTQLATVVGRYYGMDRDKRWERVAKAYHLLTSSDGKSFSSADNVFDHWYGEGVTDEFIEPSVLNTEGKIEKDDVVICFNFRTDRCREITEVLTQQNFSEHNMQTLPLHYFTMTNYDDTFKGVQPIFDKDNLTQTLGEVIANAGLTQVRIAETEKYPHVTFFFSGGREKEFEGEKRLMVNSPKVATYDLQPEMSAHEVADTITAELKENQPDFVCLNFANPDMVGHTGVVSAIIKAVEATDACCKRVVETAKELGYEAIIIADHGNADFVVNADGSPNTAHTTNPVPVILVSDEHTQIQSGILADVAPTILKLMGVAQPADMTGGSLV